VVQVLNHRLVRYLLGVERRQGLAWTVTAGETLPMHPEVISRLAPTAIRAIGSAAVAHPVRAECVVAQHIDVALGLYAYRVAALEAAPTPGTPAPRPDEAAPMTRRPPPVARPTRTGARAEILAAARRVMAASGRREFTVAEIVEDMRRHSTGYAQSTIRTLLTTHASRRPGRRCRRLQRRRVGQQGRPQASLRRCTLRARRS
jgi:hypothetical protein